MKKLLTLLLWSTGAFAQVNIQGTGIQIGGNGNGVTSITATGTALTGAVTFACGSGLTCTQSGQTITVTPTAGGAVTSLNSLTGAVNLIAGANITLAASGNNLTIASIGGTTIQTDGTDNASQSLLNFTVTSNTGIALTNPSGGIENAAGVVMGASGSSHAMGMVPDPGATAGTTHYLREDGTWDVPAGLSPAGSLVLQASNSGGTALIAATPAIMYGAVNYTNGGTFFGFGDSTMQGSAGASTLDKAMFSLLCHDYGGTCQNYGVSGALADTIVRDVITDYTVTDYLNFSRIMLDAGINDANSCGNTTGCLNNYALEMNAGIAWVGLPYTQKIMASTATQTGTWAGGGFGQGALPGLTGNAVVSTVNGSTLTFTVPSGIAGSKVGLTWEPQVSGTGTFTVSVDGTSQTNLCTGTTTFDAFGCNSQAVTIGTGFRQEFAVTPGVSHSVVVTTVGSGSVTILDVDSTLTAPSATAPLVLISGVLYQDANANSSATAAFNTEAAAAAATAIADNMNVVFVDVRGGTPGVNYTTDMGTSTFCGYSSPGALHPNDCGNFHWAQTAENAAAAAGFAFTIPNSGGRSGYFTTPLQTAGDANTNSVLQDWTPNSQNYFNGIATGMTFFNNGYSYLSRVGFGKDAASGDFATQFMSYGAQRIQFTTCTSAVPTSESQCTETFGVDNGTGNAFLKGTLSAPSLKLNGSQTVTALQGSTGTSLQAATGGFLQNAIPAWDANGNLTNSGILYTNLAALNASNTWTGNQVFDGTILVQNNATVANNVASTSSANQPCYTLSQSGTYWTGSASSIDGWTWSCVYGSTGANPTTTLELTHAGSSGATLVDINAPLKASNFQGAVILPTFTVSTLPGGQASGTEVIVTDSTSFTPGSCVGGGSDAMLAIYVGSTWTCH